MASFPSREPLDELSAPPPVFGPHPATPESEQERRKRRREVALIVLVVLLIAALTWAETRVIRFGTGIPVSNTILMFIIINVNLLLILTLFFLVIRNLVKLWYERRRKLPGSRLRTRLVMAFLSLSIVPTVLLFLFSIQFIVTSVEFWFNVPVEQSLSQSLEVGRRLYDHVEENHRFFIERISYQIKVRDYLAEHRRASLKHYIQVTQRAFNLDAVEVYDTSANRLGLAWPAEMSEDSFPPMAPGELLKPIPSPQAVRTITVMTHEGELVRTVGAVPFKAEPGQAMGFVVISTFLPADLAQGMAAISRGFQEYHQTQMLKKPIQTSFYITLSIVSLLIVFCAIWFGLYLSKTLTVPIAALAEGTRRVAGGDLGFTLKKTADDEMGSLVDAFNKMTRDLRNSRQELEYTAHQLAGQNVELEKRRQYMAVVLDNVSTGVISTDAMGRITTINKSAENMLGVEAETVWGKTYRELVPERDAEVVRQIMDHLVHGQGDFVRMPVRQKIGGKERSFMVHVSALRDEHGKFMGMVAVFDDLTELERAQRMAAWREVARRIAHEVKNPLTPIKLSAQRLARRFAEKVDDPVFSECTETIIEQVDLIRNLVNEFHTYARFPAPQPRPTDLGVLVEQACAPYQDGHPGITFTIQAQKDLPLLDLDPQQIKRAIINLVDNALGAVGESGSIRIVVESDPEANKVRLVVEDTGKGITAAEKARLFEPYFSTKKAGMGLGLSIVSTIVTDHQGTIRVEDNEPTGARFIIEFPVSDRP
ncbi:MAG: PAS domain S-box protein [Deltaproteobacteria bacterium]|nr:PAS domain S-box protein [Deltaproteobacteria bacterium]